MKSIKKFALIAFVTIYLLYTVSTVKVGADNQCMKLIPYSNTPYLAEITPDSNWSKFKISVQFMNTCPNDITISDFSITLDKIKFNNVEQAVTSGIDPHFTPSSPWLENKFSYGAYGIKITLSTPACTSSCNWAVIKPNTTEVITLDGGYSGQLNSIIANSVTISGPGIASTTYTGTSSSGGSTTSGTSNGGSTTSGTSNGGSTTSGTSNGGSTTSGTSNGGSTTSGTTNTNTTSTKKIGAYFQSWSAGWASQGQSHDLSNVARYITRVLVAFAKPDCTYTTGSTLDTSGLNFSADLAVIKEAMNVGRTNQPDLKYLLSVGGATYHNWQNLNVDCIKQVVNDVGFDGVDIDYEIAPTCTGINTATVSCNSDTLIVDIITKIKNAVPGKIVSAATWSIGAYGTDVFPNTKYAPAGSYNGLWVNPLKNACSLLDEVYIMSYDATSDYKPKKALDAHLLLCPTVSYYLGLEVPPEGWGGHVLTVGDAKDWAGYAALKNGGAFIWSYQKNANGICAGTFLEPICTLYGLSYCTDPIKDCPAKRKNKLK
jgi:chitinase